MPVTDISIYFIIAILGLAYPITLQVVSRLDEKYHSFHIIKLFNKGYTWLFFQGTFYLSIGCVIIYGVHQIFFPTPCAVGSVCYDSFDHIVMIITVLLVVSFLFYTSRVLTFYNAYDLFRALKSEPKDDDHSNFKAMADIFYASVRSQDDTLAGAANEYFYSKFREKRNDAAENKVRYPDAYYRAAYKTILEAGSSPSVKMRMEGLNAAAGRWFLGELYYTAIDELTYSWLWNNLQLMLEIGNDDYIFEFWKNSHQLSSTGLQALNIKIDQKTLKVLNQGEVDRRNEERERFFEFHFALGGMLLYEQRYDLLKSIFMHTTSIPPAYNLLPYTLTEIFRTFIRFWGHSYRMFPYRYHFRSLDGIYGEGQSQLWICRYLALLLLRQYTQSSHLYGYEPLDLPQPPDSQGERKIWIEDLDHMRGFIDDMRGNDTLMKATGLGIVTDAWCAQNGKPNPHELIGLVIANVKTAYDAGEVHQQAAAEKIASFYTRSAAIVTGRIGSYANLLNEKDIMDQPVLGVVGGMNRLSPKASFADGQPVSYVDYDTVLASSLASKITSEITGMFRSKIRKSYLLADADILKGIDQLGFHTDEHVILNFGIDIDWLNHKLKNKDLTTESYKGIPIRPVTYIDRQLIRSSFLIVKKTELPGFEYADLDAGLIQEYGLKPVGAAVNLYAAVIDLHQRPEFKKQYGETPDAELDRSVLLKLSMQLKVHWSPMAEITELRLYSELYQQGIPDKLSDVAALKQSTEEDEQGTKKKRIRSPQKRPMKSSNDHTIT